MYDLTPQIPRWALHLIAGAFWAGITLLVVVPWLYLIYDLFIGAA